MQINVQNVDHFLQNFKTLLKLRKMWFKKRSFQRKHQKEEEGSNKQTNFTSVHPIELSGQPIVCKRM